MTHFVLEGSKRDPKILEMCIFNQQGEQLLHYHQGHPAGKGLGSQEHLSLPILFQHVSLSPAFLDPVTSIYCLLFLECSFQLLQMLVEIKDLREEKRMGMYLLRILNPLKLVHC